MTYFVILAGIKTYVGLRKCKHISFVFLELEINKILKKKYKQITVYYLNYVGCYQIHLIAIGTRGREIVRQPAIEQHKAAYLILAFAQQNNITCYIQVLIEITTKEFFEKI